MKLNVYWYSGVDDFHGEMKSCYSAVITDLDKEEVKKHLKAYLEKSNPVHVGLFSFALCMAKYGLTIDDIDCDTHPLFGGWADKVYDIKDLVKELSYE